jgi:sterol desaturase/sphingolipid hydroxylase (fatty acid hydroxylase superfamily)
MGKKWKSFQLFCSIFWENLTDIEALDGAKKFMVTAKKTSLFLFSIIIAAFVGYAIIIIYCLLNGISPFYTGLFLIAWGGFLLIPTELYVRVRKRRSKQYGRKRTNNPLFA